MLELERWATTSIRCFGLQLTRKLRIKLVCLPICYVMKSGGRVGSSTTWSWLSDVIKLTEGQLNLKSDFPQYGCQWPSGLLASLSMASTWGWKIAPSGKNYKAFPAIWLAQLRSCAHLWINSTLTLELLGTTTHWLANYYLLLEEKVGLPSTWNMVDIWMKL